MENLREILEKLTPQDYIEHKVDLHLHTIHSDGNADPLEIVKSAKEKNYKLISITDHNTVNAHKEVKDSILVTGVEFDCWVGYVFIHLLAYGIDTENPDLQKFFAKNKKDTESAVTRLFSFRNTSDLIKAIHSAGGIAILAHPACCWAINLEHLIKKLMGMGLDGIETYYPYPRFRGIVKFHSAKTVLKIAQKYRQLIVTGGTDFHGKNF